MTSLTTYAHGPELDMSEITACPEYQVTVETSREDWGFDTHVTATMVGAELGAGKDALGLTRAQCLAIFGIRAVAAAEAAFADKFDAQQAIADEADALADYRYEQWKDRQMEAAE